MSGRVVPLFPAPAAPADFDDFWALYPRRVARLHARNVWQRMAAADRRAALEAIPRQAAAWFAEGREPRYIPHAGTWLNGRRWEDEFESSPAAQAERIARQISA